MYKLYTRSPRKNLEWNTQWNIKGLRQGKIREKRRQGRFDRASFINRPHLLVLAIRQRGAKGRNSEKWGRKKNEGQKKIELGSTVMYYENSCFSLISNFLIVNNFLIKFLSQIK